MQNHIKYLKIVQYKKLKKILFDEILNAQETIFCEFSGLTDSDLINLLSQKVSKGVHVFIRGDEKKYKENELLIPLGIEEKDFIVVSRSRIHSKYIIIDGYIILIFTSSLQEKFNNQQLYDSICKIENQRIAELLSQQKLSEKDITELKNFSILIRDPSSQVDSLTSTLREAIEDAHKIIFLSKDIRPHSFFLKLKEKAKNISVKLFLSPKFKNDPSINFEKIDCVVQNDISERMHANVLSVDNDIYVGSAYLKERCIGDLNHPHASKEMGIWIKRDNSANKIDIDTLIKMY